MPIRIIFNVRVEVDDMVTIAQDPQIMKCISFVFRVARVYSSMYVHIYMKWVSNGKWHLHVHIVSL